MGIGVAALLCSASIPSAAFAEGTHVFDPILSLTGDCSSSPATPLDEIPDPGCPGGNHPLTPFKSQSPRAVVTDFYGNIYVSSPGPQQGLSGFPEGKIAIFDSSGNFITEVKDEAEPQAIAVDSKGNLYVVNGYDPREEGLARYEPTGTYNPEEGEIEYGDPPTILVKTETSGSGLAINPLNDHLFRKRNIEIIEYSSAAEGNTVVEKHIGEGKLQLEETGIAVDAAHGRLYATTWQGEPGEITKVVRVFELAPPHNLIFTLEESEVPGGNIQSSFLSVAADEGTGHFFLYDGDAKKVYEFKADGTYVSTIAYPFQYTFRSQIGIDNGKFSSNGALNPTERYLYVPSNPRGSEPTGHTFAFGSPSEGEPIVEAVSFANVGETEAELQASIEPSGAETHYTFQYLTQQQFEENGNSFAGVPVAGEGEVPAVHSPRDVAAAPEGLQPGTRYRFRVFVENSLGNDEGEGEFATFVAAGSFETCLNDPLRTGFSALLPDCRAYELVTPPDTNARAPRGIGYMAAPYFATRQASPTGGVLSFQIEGGIIPGSEGTGSLGGDPYLSTRTEGGWSTADAGPSGSEAPQLVSGSISPDQGYSFWSTNGSLGSAAVEGETTFYVRYPDGHSALIGRGSLASDPRAKGLLISQDGGHIIFTSGDDNPAIQLEPNAPPSGTATIYDRTSDEVTRVVSLLPGNKTPKAGEGARYEGASLDGKGIAFQLAGKLYLRYNDEETYELGEGLAFAGIAEGGARAFYLQGGKLWRFDATTEEATEFSSGPVIPVNVSADGSVAYFVSQSALTGEPSPNGQVAQGGQENLYRSEEGAISFVGIVTKRDVEGESNGIEPVEGLGLWAEAVSNSPFGNAGRLAVDPSRTTPDGNALLFESRAVLDGYDPQGHAEVYRYDFEANELDCLSCNPTLAPASSNASLQSIAAGFGDPDFEPLSSSAYVANLRADGKRAFFQSDEALVPSDVDGLKDVYEWEAQGVGSCKREGGCIYLVSSGHSLRTDYLYAASDTGDDVFFRTGDILLPRDAEETPSIYDARVGGGFAEGSKIPCVVAAECPPPVTPPPNLASPRTPALGPPDNYRETGCPKGKHKVKRNGKVTCVKKKKNHKKHHKKKARKSRRAGK
jgi:hypothetical protein